MAPSSLAVRAEVYQGDAAPPVDRAFRIELVTGHRDLVDHGKPEIYKLEG